jgi:hypothetical protein
MHGIPEDFPSSAQRNSLLETRATPRPIAADWHHFYGTRLVVFPRCLCLAAHSRRGVTREVCYWPDLATFLEDRESRRMMYYPSDLSRYSVCIAYVKDGDRWEAAKYCDAQLLRHCVGVSFAEAMGRALEFGLEWDEMVRVA